jgi:hypothetical protein
VSTHADTPTARKRAVTRVVKEVAEKMGNTPAVCRASYIDPRIIDLYDDGVTISRDLDSLGADASYGEPAFQGAIEAAVLACSATTPPSSGWPAEPTRARRRRATGQDRPPYRGRVTRSVRLPLALLAVLCLLGVAQPAGAQSAPPQSTWHADQARITEARAPGRGGDGVLVAVLDTWVDSAHADFEGRVVPGADCTSGTCTEGVPAGDQCDHGTHVAGSVVSSSYGVAPRARVLPVKVLAYDASATPPACNGSVAGVAAGIRFATARGAKVINLSLGTLVPGLSTSTAISAAVAEAARAGVLVVFAAGNASVPVTDTYGGDALIVAATGPNGQLASYSQRGAGVSLAAPGGDPGTGASCAPQTCVTSLFPAGGTPSRPARPWPPRTCRRRRAARGPGPLPHPPAAHRAAARHRSPAGRRGLRADRRDGGAVDRAAASRTAARPPRRRRCRPHPLRRPRHPHPRRRPLPPQVAPARSRPTCRRRTPCPARRCRSSSPRWPTRCRWRPTGRRSP